MMVERDPAPRVLVTGASGFIGTNLIDRYLRAGVACCNFDVSEPRNPEQRNVWVQGDLRDPQAITALIRDFRPTHLFHLGARTDMEGISIEDYTSNTVGTESLVTALETSSFRPLLTVIASTRLVTPVGYQPENEFDVCPDTPYGQSKLNSEQCIRASSLTQWVIVRPTSIWGPWFGAPYRQFFTNVIRQRYVHPRGLFVHKTFGFVENCIEQLHRLAFETPHEALLRRAFYLGDPPVEVGAFADTIADESRVPRPRRVPKPLLQLAAFGGDVGSRLGLFGEAPLTSTRLRNLCTDMVFDLDDTFRLLGQPDIGLDEGVRRTLTWLGRQPDVQPSR